MINEQQVEKALFSILNSAQRLAEAKRNRVYFEEFKKTIKAKKVLEATGTILEKESYAYAHHDYLANTKALAVAVEEEERIKWENVHNQALIEVWRSQEATKRLGV